MKKILSSLKEIILYKKKVVGLTFLVVVISFTVYAVLTQKGDIRSGAKMIIGGAGQCRSLGMACNDYSPCCSPGVCLNGHCVTSECGGVGEACSDGNPCCDPTSPCVGGVCVALACGWEGVTCTADTPCCANYDCISKTGTSFPVCVKRCGLAGEACNILPCCDSTGVCNNRGVCESPGCVGVGQVCDNTLPCCDSNNICLKGVCQRGSATPSGSPSPTPTPPAPGTFPQGSLKGDVNNDRKVDIIDIGVIIDNYGSTNAVADVNGDGIVNIVDIGILIDNYGK